MGFNPTRAELLSGVVPKKACRVNKGDVLLNLETDKTFFE